MAYCLPTDVMEYLGIDSGEDGDLLTVHIAAAQNAIDNHCRRTFEAGVDSIRYVDALGDHIRNLYLFLDEVGELCQITSIVNGDGITVATGEYVTEPRNRTPYEAIKLRSDKGKLWTYSTYWENAIAINGRWAYSITAPAVIKQACIGLAAFYYRQKDQPFSDVTAVEAGVVVRPVGIPAYIRTMLQGYTKP
jgi:hypothetical protein